MIEMSKRGWRTSEPYPIFGESPSLLASTVTACQRECQLSEEELADRLAISVHQVRAWLQPFPGQKPTPVVADDGPRLRLVNGF